MVSKQKKEAEKNLLIKAKNRFLAIKFLTIFTLFIGTAILIVFVATSLIPSYQHLSSQVNFSPVDGLNLQSFSSVYIFTALILLLSLITNIFLFMTLKRMSDSLLISNQDIETLKQNQNDYHKDDIKELVATRDMLLYKIIDGKIKKR